MLKRVGIKGDPIGIKIKAFTATGIVGLAVASAALLGMAPADPTLVTPETSEPKLAGSTASAPAKATPPLQIAALPDKPAQASLPLEPTTEKVDIELQPGDTLIAALSDAGLPYAEAHSAAQGLESVVDPRRLKAGQAITLNLQPVGEDDEPHLLSLSLVPDLDRLVVLEHQPDERFSVVEQQIDHVATVTGASAIIETSLYEAASAERVPMAILMDTYRVLGHAVDFQRDIQPGDTFSLGYEMLDDGELGPRHPGNLVYASLTLGERTLSIHRYTTRDGYTGFFNTAGRSIETSLMRTPVEGGRLSSLFGKRNHPVLGYTRMHKGLDFAAPRGAPVLAAGDGIVEKRERFGGFGKYIRIRHNETYKTAYAHLSRYAEGLQPGDRVTQGQIIAYVGATGVATGPNLHYEVLADDKPQNPVKLDLPPRLVLTGDELARFQRSTAEQLAAFPVNTTRKPEPSLPNPNPLQAKDG